MSGLREALAAIAVSDGPHETWSQQGRDHDYARDLCEAFVRAHGPELAAVLGECRYWINELAMDNEHRGGHEKLTALLARLDAVGGVGA